MGLFIQNKTRSPSGVSILSGYEQHVRSKPTFMREIPLLAGKTLGCWCKPNTCHGEAIIKEYFEVKQFEDVDDDCVI